MQEFTVDKRRRIVTETEKTRSGFKHTAILLENGREVDRTKINYYNRTWESFEYESVLQKMLGKHPEIPARTKKRFFARASGEDQARVASQFKTTAAVARMGEVIGKDDEEKAAWKQRMIKAGVPEIEFPEGWESLPASERNARMDKVLEVMEAKKSKKKDKKMRRL